MGPTKLRSERPNPSLPELVRGQVHGDAPDVPEAADDELAHHQAEEERDALAEALAAAVAQDHQLEEPGDEERHPDQVDLPTAGDREAQRVERPPREARPHRLEEQGDQEADD